jgi:hypothetical protein
VPLWHFSKIDSASLERYESKGGIFMTLRPFKRARQIARKAWIDSNRDPDKAVQLAEEQARMEFISLATIILIIQFISALINFWQLMNVEDPGDDPLTGEPSVEDEDL